jgi:phosphomannomutase
MWIDGDGETCQLVDERGAWVDGGTFFLALCRHACQARPGVGIVLEPAAPSELHGALERLGARVIRGESTRQGMCERMKSAGAWLGGGTSGRYWYFGPPAMSDALWSLSMLVSLLSQSDRPLSEVLDEARGPG